MSDAPHLDAGVSGFVLPPNWDRSIVLADESVNVSGISPKMVVFLHTCAELHEALFDEFLCLTSGHACHNAQGSKHSLWKAVDVRCAGMDCRGKLLFVSCLMYISIGQNMVILDVCPMSGAGHIHIEEAG